MATAKPKKLTINVKRPVDVPRDILETKWGALKAFLDSLHSLGGAKNGDRDNLGAQHSYEELYGAVADICVHKLGAGLYAKLRSECADRAEALVTEAERSRDDDTTLLRAVQRIWSAHSSEMTLTRAVFVYLDRTLLSSSLPSAAPAPGGGGAQQPLPLWDMGLVVLCDALRRRTSLIPRIVDALCAQVRRERSGETVDRPTLAAVSRMLVALDLYARAAEPALVRGAEAHYKEEGVLRSSASTVPQYLQAVESRLLEERERVVAYLAPTTLRPLVQAVDTHMVAAHLTHLLERGFVPLIQQGKTADLARLHALASRVGRTEEVRASFGAYCKANAKAIVGDKDDDEEKDKLLVPSLISLRDEMEGVIRACFGGAETFFAALKSAIEIAVNARENKPAELVARYLDGRLRGGARDAGSEAALERELDKVMVLFRSVHGKDVFEAFYKKDLAKRLLLGRVSSMDTEKAMVARLKTECGSQFTSKLEGMFKDMDVAKDIHAQFLASKQAAAELGQGGIDFSVQVLTSSYWPSYPAMPAILPPDMARAAKAFESFYAAKYGGNRRLQWQNVLGHCIVKAAFPAGRKELDVSLSQTLVLLLFNSSGGGGGGGGSSSAGDAEQPIPFPRIKEETGLEDAEVRRTLQSLACGQARVLRKEPKGRDVEDADVFFFNAQFTAPLMRVKINQIQLKETKQEVDATNEKVMQDRQYQMDAAIVRIMKARKTLQHQVLLAELFAQLRFSAKPSDINARIESLVQRDYLERDERDPQTYVYLA